MDETLISPTMDIVLMVLVAVWTLFCTVLVLGMGRGIGCLVPIIICPPLLVVLCLLGEKDSPTSFVACPKCGKGKVPVGKRHPRCTRCGTEIPKKDISKALELGTDL